MSINCIIAQGNVDTYAYNNATRHISDKQQKDTFAKDKRTENESERGCVYAKEPKTAHTRWLLYVRLQQTTSLNLLSHTQLHLRWFAEQSAECKREQEKERDTETRTISNGKISLERLQTSTQWWLPDDCESMCAYEYTCTVQQQHSYCAQKYIKHTHAEEEWETATMK